MSSHTSPERRRLAVASLRSYMAARGLTATEVSVILGVSRPSVTGWLHGSGMSKRCLDLVEKLVVREQDAEPLLHAIKRGMSDALKTAMVCDMVASKTPSECLVQVVSFLRDYDMDAVLQRLIPELDLKRKPQKEHEDGGEGTEGQAIPARQADGAAGREPSTVNAGVQLP